MSQSQFGGGCIASKCKIVALLFFMTVTLYLSVELCLFISDQYVFYSAVTEQGLPYLTRQERHKYRNFSSEDQIKLKIAQRKAATLEATSNSVRITVGLITMLIVGYISDRFGRRLALAILLLGEILHIATTSLIVLMKLNVWLIIASGFFEACFGGGLLSLYSQVAAVMVDVTRLSHSKDHESSEAAVLEKINQEVWVWFTVFESIALLCASLGSPVGGTLIYRYGFKTAVITCICLLIPSLLLIFILPETNRVHNECIKVNKQDKKTHTDNRNVNNDELNDVDANSDYSDSRTIEMEGNWKQKFTGKLKMSLYAMKSLSGILIIVVIVVILCSITSLVDLQYIVIYLMGSPFLWNPQEVGIYIGVSDLVSSIVGIVYTIIVIKFRLRKKSKQKGGEIPSQSETTNNASKISFKRHMKLLVYSLAGSLAMMAANKVMMAVAYGFPTRMANIIVYIAAIPRLMKSFVAPIARSMFSLCAPPGNQGMVQSFGGFVARIGVLISLTALPALYAATVTVFPQTVFIVVSAMTVVAIIFDLLILKLRALDPVLVIIMSVALFGSISALADLQYVAVYLMGPPFLWSPERVGLYSGITDVTAAVISVVFTIVIIKLDEKKKARAKATEADNVTNENVPEPQRTEKHYTRLMNLLVAVLAISLLMLIINRTAVGLAHRFQLPTADIIIYVAAVPRLMKSFCTPLARTMFSICTPPSKQGVMQSVGAFVSRIGLLISLTVLPAIYAATVLTFPAAVFIVVVVLITITLILDL
nr:unnamed protein product [Trichobilharzia regenti]